MYFLIKNEKGEAISIKKKSFCWLLNDEHNKLSNDRMIRFQSGRGAKNSVLQPRLQSLPIVERDGISIKIGDWCQFRHGKGVVIGQVIGFLYLNKKTKKEARYSSQCASVSDKALGVLGNWFSVQKGNFIFKFIETFIQMTDYIKHISKPNVTCLSYK